MHLGVRMCLYKENVHSKSSSSPKRLSIFALPNALWTSMCCMTSRLMALSGARRRSSFEKRCGETGYIVLVRVSRLCRICSWKISTFFLDAGLSPLASVENNNNNKKRQLKDCTMVTTNHIPGLKRSIPFRQASSTRSTLR